MSNHYKGPEDYQKQLLADLDRAPIKKAKPLRLTRVEKAALAAACGFVLSGEADGWDSLMLAALRRAHTKLFS
jgi:hypothetical protein